MAIEIIGYISSVIVLISLSMKSLVKLRVLNAIGSIFFVVFAVLTFSYPTAFLNLGIVVIDIVYLVHLKKRNDTFEIVPVERTDEIVTYIYTRNKKEIDFIFGDEAFEKANSYGFYFRNNEIAGFFAYSIKVTDLGAKVGVIHIDYVTPTYRDVAIGKHFYVKDLSFWQSQGIVSLEYIQPEKVHIKYIEKLGFRQQYDPTIWGKKI